EIADIKKSPLSEFTKLTKTGFLKWDLRFSPDGKRYLYRKMDPDDGGALILKNVGDTETSERIEIEAGSTNSLCWGSRGKREILIFPKEKDASNYALNYLSGYDISTKKRIQFEALDSKDDLKHVQHIGCSQDLSKILVYQEAATVGVVKEYFWEGEEPKLKLM